MACENSTCSSLPQILCLLAKKGKSITPEQITGRIGLAEVHPG